MKPILRGFAFGLLTLLTASIVTTHQSSPAPLTAHEWGTFTSIAGPDGLAMEWLPLTGSTDLPTFVEHLANTDFKGGLRGIIRMETPVLYFYSAQETTAFVHATFSKGVITEWYPHASVPALDPRRDFVLEPKRAEGAITWKNVHVQPTAAADFPFDHSESHYYAARQTAAAPLFVDTTTGPHRERFLFYRGVSAILPPLTATLTPDGSVILKNHLPAAVANSGLPLPIPGMNRMLAALQSAQGLFFGRWGLQPPRNGDRESRALAPEASVPSEADSANEIPTAILFERRGSRLGYRVLGPLASEATVAPPTSDGSLDSLYSTLEGLLISQGLFPDEAHAMLETWKSSWFDDGARILYIVPRRFVDSVLPLSISPAPAQLTRVFVGRLELITPATQQAVASAFATNDQATLVHYARFLEPILITLLNVAPDAPTRAHYVTYLKSIYSRPRN
jgi:hypothetical protein